MNNEILQQIITTPMPYGKYKGTMIADLPLRASLRESLECSWPLLSRLKPMVSKKLSIHSKSY